MDLREERVPAEMLTVAIPPFTASKHLFFHEDDVTVKVACDSDMHGFELSTANAWCLIHITHQDHLTM